MPRAKVHRANVLDQEGIKALLLGAEIAYPRLSHLWADAGYRGEALVYDAMIRLMSRRLARV